MKILVIDIGGTNVKMLATGQEVPRKFPSGPDMTPERMVAGVREAARDWEYEAITVGFPGPVLCGSPLTEPVNLGRGWMGFDFAAAFGCPVKVINDAAMQALGSYLGGRMLFLGLGTGIGAAMIVDGVLEPLEIGRYHYKKYNLEYYIGSRGFKRQGRKKWQRQVEAAVSRLVKALKPDDVVLGGGNAKKLDPLPPGTRLGDNSLAFVGGFRLWDGQAQLPSRVTITTGENGEAHSADEQPSPRPDARAPSE